MTSPLSGRRVLVVEDEMMIAMLIEDILADQGCRLVGPAIRVVDALRLLDAEWVEVALLDVNLNGEDTYPIAEELRRRNIPFVFATGYGAAGVKAGYGQFVTLQKPFEADDLTEALAGALATVAN